MLKVEVGYSGIRELAGRCRVDFLITPFVGPFTLDLARKTAEAAARLAPRKTGRLAGGHQARLLDSWHAEVINTVPYAPFVHFGTRPHWPPASSGLPFPVRRAIALRGTKPHPWLPQAVEQASTGIGGSLESLAGKIAGAWSHG